MTPRDPRTAELLQAELARFRDPTPENRARETSLLQLAEPHAPGYRAQIGVGSLFEANVTILHDDEHRGYAWVYDDDLASIDVRGKGDIWQYNVDAYEQLPRAVTRDVTSIRLCLFEGTSRMFEALAEHDALDRVTHLDLRTQSGRLPDPVGRFVPGLGGLTCMHDELAALLDAGATELEGLAVWLNGWKPEVLDRAMALPKLRHLALWSGPPTGDDLTGLATHPILDRLMSLDLAGSSNDAAHFPFTALVENAAAFGYLNRLALPGHLVPLEVRGRVARALPDVPTFVSHDRREMMAVDFEMLGWGGGAR